MEFPALLNGVGQQSQCINPPYRIDAYARALLDAPPSTTMTALVSDKRIALNAPNARGAIALESGSYKVVVNDQTTKRRFVLSGQGLTRSTTAKFRGRISWQVVLRPGVYSYGAKSYGGAGTFEVMSDK